jgi:hypothetical protein
MYITTIRYLSLFILLNPAHVSAHRHIDRHIHRVHGQGKGAGFAMTQLAKKGGTDYAMRVSEVVGHFLQREPGWSGSLTSDSRRLMSYGTVIAEWIGAAADSIVMVEPNRADTRSTARHKGLLQDMAAARGITLEFRDTNR